MPSFTRKGLPAVRDFSSLARRSASRMISAEPFLRYASCSSTEAKIDMRKRHYKEMMRPKREPGPGTIDELLGHRFLFDDHLQMRGHFLVQLDRDGEFAQS